MTTTVEAVGGPHDGAQITVRRGVQRLHFVIRHDQPPVVYDVEPHPYRKRWGAVFDPLHWPDDGWRQT